MKQTLLWLSANDCYAGLSRLLLMQLLLTQKVFAHAAPKIRRCREFHETSRSPVWISPNFRRPFRRRWS